MRTDGRSDPLAPPQTGTALGGPDAAAEAGPGHRILIVEDEYFIAAEMEDRLRAAEIDVLGPVGTVSEALRLVEAAADGEITAAVLDVSLHGERVTPVAEALTARGIPFVYATGYARQDFAHQPMAAVLVKPLDYGDLFRSLDGLGTGVVRRQGVRKWGRAA